MRGSSFSTFKTGHFSRPINVAYSLLSSKFSLKVISFIGRYSHFILTSLFSGFSDSRFSKYSLKSKSRFFTLEPPPVILIPEPNSDIFSPVILISFLTLSIMSLNLASATSDTSFWLSCFFNVSSLIDNSKLDAISANFDNAETCFLLTSSESSIETLNIVAKSLVTE